MGDISNKKMGDISNTTLAILIVAILAISLLSTWLILSQRSMDLSWMDNTDQGQGRVTLYVEGAELAVPLQDGKITLVVLPPEQIVGAT